MGERILPIRSKMLAEQLYYPRQIDLKDGAISAAFDPDSTSGITEPALFGVRTNNAAGAIATIHPLPNDCEARIVFQTDTLNGCFWRIVDGSVDGYEVEVLTGSLLLNRLDAGVQTQLDSWTAPANFVTADVHRITLEIADHAVMAYWDGVCVMHAYDSTHRLTAWTAEWEQVVDAVITGNGVYGDGEFLASVAEADAWATGGGVTASAVAPSMTLADGWYGHLLGIIIPAVDFRLCCDLVPGVGSQHRICLVTPDHYRGYMVDIQPAQYILYRVDAGFASITNLGTHAGALPALFALSIDSGNVKVLSEDTGATLLTSADTTIRRGDLQVYGYSVSGAGTMAKLYITANQNSSGRAPSGASTIGSAISTSNAGYGLFKPPGGGGR